MGGTRRSIRILFIIIFFAGIWIVIEFGKVYNIKQTNYTELHRQMAELKQEMVRCCKEQPND